MSIVDAQGTRVVPPGAVNLWIGGGQPGGPKPAAGTAAQLTVNGREVLQAF